MKWDEVYAHDEEILFPCFKAVAQNMRRVRKEYGLTQKEMSEILNIDPQYYARLERGDDPKRKFTLEKVFLACGLFGVSPNDMMNVLPDFKKQGIDDIPVCVKNEIVKSVKVMNAIQLKRMRGFLKNISKE